MSGCRENFPEGLAGTRLWHLPDFTDFYLKYVFLNNSGAFKRFQNCFTGNVRLNVWIQFSKIKGKTILSASEDRIKIDKAKADSGMPLPTNDLKLQTATP